VDFAADDPFARVALKLREHYGFEIGESTIQRIALGHAQAIFESGCSSPEFPKEPGRHKQIVAQIDGGMVPVVMPDATRTDKRKGKTLSWREAKISLAHAKGSRTPVYGGGIEGGVEEAGRRLFACAVRVGFGADSRVHAVGDGAPPASAGAGCGSWARSKTCSANKAVIVITHLGSSPPPQFPAGLTVANRRTSDPT